MNKLLKSIVLLTLCTNAYILRAMADEKSDRSHVLKPTVFKSTRITTDTDTGESTQPPAKKREILSTAGTSAFRTFQRHATTASGDSPIVPSVMESATDSSISPASSTMEDDMTKLLHVVLARAKEEFDHSHTHAIAGTQTSSSAASSSSACAASPTDVSAPSSIGASCSSADDDLLQYCSPLPVLCPWPNCPNHATYFSPPCKEIPGLTQLSKHIRNVHKQECEADGFRCPHTDSKKSFGCHGRLVEHLLSTHNHSAAFQCNICAEKKTFSQKTCCDKHVQVLHKQVGKYHCNCNSRSSTHSGWCEHIRKCPKLETRIRENRYFWCPCGDACTKEEALRHVKLCARARDGMVYVDSEKHVASTHDECMDRLGLEKTADSSAADTAASTSSSSASANPTPDTAPSGEK